MNRLLAIRAATAVAGGLLFWQPRSPLKILLRGRKRRTSRSSRGQRSKLPTTRNHQVGHQQSGGDDDHYSVIRYGTDPNDLSQTAKNHIRLNQSHPETIFRVRVMGLQPATTY